MHIVMIGNTGSGKTTVAKLLTKSLNLPHVYSGRIARTLSESDPSTDLALRMGALAPEQAMRAAIRAELEAAEIQRGGWVLDGFPRSTEQLVCLTQWSQAMPVFVHLDIGAWRCIERLAARARPDDNPDAIARKFLHYEEHVRPMLEILGDGGVLYNVDATQTPEEIVNQIQVVLS